jgi:alpha-amylase
MERAYERAYLPVLKTLADHAAVHAVLHHSGTLMEGLLAEKGEYLGLLRHLVDRGQVEILSSPIYEPILAAIPERDRVGQIRAHGELIERLFGVVPRGAWLAERVWEPSLPKALGLAGIEYVPLDDTPFLRIGFSERRLFDSFQTEEEGLPVRVFPTPRSLCRLIPFARPEETISYLQKRQSAGARVAVYAGPGEAFGALPGTWQSVQETQWLSKLFALLEGEQHRMQTSTFAEYVDSFAPAGQVYLPTGANAELLEWSLPPGPQRRHQDLRSRLEREGDGMERLLGTGYWRNFLVRYPEANWMHKRGLFLNRRLLRLEETGGADPELVREARRHVWRSQCNTVYWHGEHGGIYMPNLRAAVHKHQLAAWKIMDDLEHGDTPFVSFLKEDINFDGDDEVLLENRQLALTLVPHDGGSLVALDVKALEVNVLDTIARREESYHKSVRERMGEAGGPRGRRGREERDPSYLNYDPFPLHSLRDHFLPAGHHVRNLQELRTLSAPPSRTRMVGLRAGPGRVSIRGDFRLEGHSVDIERVIALDPEAARFRVEWRVELPDGLPEGIRRFATEWTFGFGGDAPSLASGRADGEGEEEVETLSRVELTDPAGRVRVTFDVSPACRYMRFPVETVSLDEGRASPVRQGSRVFVAWLLPDGARRFEAVMDVSVGVDAEGPVPAGFVALGPGDVIDARAGGPDGAG